MKALSTPRPPRTTAARLALNCLCGGGLNVVTALVSIFLTPLILRQMGDQRYGVWAVLGSFYGYATLLQLGLYSAVNRYVPMYLARDEEVKLRQVTSTVLAFFVVMGMLILGLTLAFGDMILGWFAIPAPLLPAAHLALYAVGGVAALSLALNSFGAVLSGYQRYELLALGRLLAMGLRVTLVLVLLSRGEPLVMMALIFGATECLVGLLNLWFGWRLMPAQPLQWQAVTWSMLREMFGYGVNTFVYAAGAVVLAKTGEVIVGAYLPPENITYYTLALMPPMMLSGLVESVVGSIKPAVADLDSRNDLFRIRELTLLSQKYVLLFMVPAMAFFVILGNDFYAIWLHRDLHEAVVLLYVLAAGHLMHTVQFPLFLVLAGRGEHRVFGLLTVVMAVAAVALGLFFCRILAWGSLGVAIGSSLAMLTVSGVVLPLHAAKRIGIRQRDFLLHSWLPALCGAAPPILFLILAKRWQPPASLLELALLGLAVGLVALPSIWGLALSKLERERFSRMALDSLQKLAPASLFEKLTKLRHL